MVNRHVPLWNFIEKFVHDNSIGSIVDVGGGMGYAKKFCTEYIMFDKNPKMVKLLSDEGVHAYLGDFIQADISLMKYYDLVLLLAVVEHTDTLRSFIVKSLQIEPKFILISFFRGFQERDEILDISCNRKLRLYSRNTVQDIISELCIKDATLFSVPRDKTVVYPKNTVFDDLLLICSNT